jgi:hypothetical protein
MENVKTPHFEAKYKGRTWRSTKARKLKRVLLGFQE